MKMQQTYRDTDACFKCTSVIVNELTPLLVHSFVNNHIQYTRVLYTYTIHSSPSSRLYRPLQYVLLNVHRYNV